MLVLPLTLVPLGISLVRHNQAVGVTGILAIGLGLLASIVLKIMDHDSQSSPDKDRSPHGRSDNTQGG